MTTTKRTLKNAIGLRDSTKRRSTFRKEDSPPRCRVSLWLSGWWRSYCVVLGHRWPTTTGQVWWAGSISLLGRGWVEVGKQEHTGRDWGAKSLGPKLIRRNYLLGFQQNFPWGWQVGGWQWRPWCSMCTLLAHDLKLSFRPCESLFTSDS